jgi:hypothetical protein
VFPFHNTSIPQPLQSTDPTLSNGKYGIAHCLPTSRPTVIRCPVLGIIGLPVSRSPLRPTDPPTTSHFQCSPLSTNELSKCIIPNRIYELATFIARRTVLHHWIGSIAGKYDDNDDDDDDNDVQRVLQTQRIVGRVIHRL